MFHHANCIDPVSLERLTVPCDVADSTLVAMIYKGILHFAKTKSATRFPSRAREHLLPMQRCFREVGHTVSL